MFSSISSHQFTTANNHSKSQEKTYRFEYPAFEYPVFPILRPPFVFSLPALSSSPLVERESTRVEIDECSRLAHEEKSFGLNRGLETRSDVLLEFQIPFFFLSFFFNEEFFEEGSLPRTLRNRTSFAVKFYLSMKLVSF